MMENEWRGIRESKVQLKKKKEKKREKVWFSWLYYDVTSRPGS
jgi:hypothetical protein